MPSLNLCTAVSITQKLENVNTNTNIFGTFSSNFEAKVGKNTPLCTKLRMRWKFAILCVHFVATIIPSCCGKFESCRAKNKQFPSTIKIAVNYDFWHGSLPTLDFKYCGLTKERERKQREWCF